jgi:hypothetical protein
MVVQGGSRGEGSWRKPESISTDGSLQRMAEIIRAMGPDASTMDVIGLESVGPKGEGQDELPPRPSVREYRRDGRVVTETTQ